MGRQLSEDRQLIYSVAPETAINTPYDETAQFASALFNQFRPPFPKTGKYKSNEIGGQNEWGSKSRNGYAQPWTPTIGGWLKTGFPAIMLKRAAGGAVTNTLVATGVYDHVVSLQPKAQRTPVLTTMGVILGGEDFLHASVAVNLWEAVFGEGGPPSWSIQVTNSGLYSRLRDIDPAILIPGPPADNFIHPASVAAHFNDGSLQNFIGRLISGRCGLNNQVVVGKDNNEGYPGDPYIGGNRKNGAYHSVMRRGKRAYNPTLKIAQDEEFEEFLTAMNNTDITDLTFLFQGEQIGATAYFHEIELVYPLSTLDIDPDTDGPDDAILLTFDTDREGAGQIVEIRVRDGNPTLV